MGKPMTAQSFEKRAAKKSPKPPPSGRKPKPANVMARYKIFAHEYVKDLNATRAAKATGYSEKTAYCQGQRLSKHAEVRKLIQAEMDARSSRTQITADYVLTTIQETIERCKQAVPVTVRIDGELIETGEYKFDATNVLKGAELLGKHLKLFTDKCEVTGADGGPIQIENVREEIRAKLFRK